MESTALYITEVSYQIDIDEEGEPAGSPFLVVGVEIPTGLDLRLAADVTGVDVAIAMHKAASGNSTGGRGSCTT